MKKLVMLLSLGVIFTSCEKTSPLDDYIETYEAAYADTTHATIANIDYKFNMVGRY